MASFFRRGKRSKEKELEDSDDEVRVVLIGKTGAGKSSLGNTIAGDKKFKEVRGMRSGTQKTEMTQVTDKKGRQKIRVIDTPGVCDTKRKSVEVYEEIAKCMIAAAPGPHAILMVLRASERFTEEEAKAYDELRSLFWGFSQHLIIVFTRLDELEEGGSTLDDELRECPPKVHEIIEEAEHRVVGVKNKGKWSERKAQGAKVMKEINEMMEKNNRKIFTNKCLEKTAKMLHEESETRHMSPGDIKKEAVEEKNGSLLEKIKDVLSSLTFTHVQCSVM